MLDRFLDLRLLHYSLTSAEHGSFRRAAAALNVQQSTVSRGIRDLEHHLGTTLFERDHSGIRPTPVGERFLDEVRSGFELLQSATRNIGGLKHHGNGEVTVAASVPFALFADLLETFRERNQNASIGIREDTCNASCASVRQRKVDIAFVAHAPANGSLHSLHLRDERMMVVLPLSHRLAKARAVVLADLQLDRFILGAGGFGPAIIDYLRRNRTRTDEAPDIQVHSVGLCDLVTMVARGFGVTIIVGRLSHAVPDGVVLVPLAGKGVVPVYAIWMAANPNPSLRRLLSVVQRAASSRTGVNRSGGNK